MQPSKILKGTSRTSLHSSGLEMDRTESQEAENNSSSLYLPQTKQAFATWCSPASGGGLVAVDRQHFGWWQ